MIKETLDQLAHAGIAFACVFLLGPWGALIIPAAYVRELWQKNWDVRRQWHGAGSWRDMFFWSAGALLASPL